MWSTARETASHPQDLELVCYTDDDDPSYYQLDSQLPGKVIMLRGERIVLSQMWNACANTANGDILWHGADDIRFRTPAWDLAVVNAFDREPDRIVFVHGRDGIHDDALGTHGFVSVEWVAAVGSFVPPYFSSDYNDAWLTDVADRIGRRVFLPNVYTEHMHPVAQKGPWDVTHTERLARHQQDGVDGMYVALEGEREQWAEKLRAVMR